MKITVAFTEKERDNAASVVTVLTALLRFRVKEVDAKGEYHHYYLTSKNDRL